MVDWGNKAREFKSGRLGNKAREFKSGRLGEQSWGVQKWSPRGSSVYVHVRLWTMRPP